MRLLPHCSRQISPIHAVGGNRHGEAGQRGGAWPGIRLEGRAYSRLGVEKLTEAAKEALRDEESAGVFASGNEPHQRYCAEPDLGDGAHGYLAPVNPTSYLTLSFLKVSAFTK